MKQELKLHIILESPPLNVDFGLQKGSGSIYETMQIQRSRGEHILFDLEVKIKNEVSKLEEPNFVGPFVQGTAPDKFIYIDIGTYAAQKDSAWGRRLKVPLKGVTWQMVTKVQADASLHLETQVPGTGKDGGPNCATVKPFAGWKIKGNID